ncbi:MAG TPA: hypothetical protein VK638_00615, partial [Edaphobacter sp.]|nr:hypothetical protein [Edaphobacter sp.]
TFDLVAGEERKEAGIALASDRRAGVWGVALDTARRIARERGEVTADDVYRSLIAQGMDPLELGNAAGSIFRSKDFEFTGRWKKSKRISNHARQNRVWRLREVRD